MNTTITQMINDPTTPVLENGTSCYRMVTPDAPDIRLFQRADNEWYFPAREMARLLKLPQDTKSLTHKVDAGERVLDVFLDARGKRRKLWGVTLAGLLEMMAYAEPKEAFSLLKRISDTGVVLRIQAIKELMDQKKELYGYCGDLRAKCDALKEELTNEKIYANEEHYLANYFQEKYDKVKCFEPFLKLVEELGGIREAIEARNGQRLY